MIIISSGSVCIISKSIEYIKEGPIHVNERFIQQKYTHFDAYPKELFTFLHNIFATNCLQYEENNNL